VGGITAEVEACVKAYADLSKSSLTNQKKKENIKKEQSRPSILELEDQQPLLNVTRRLGSL